MAYYALHLKGAHQILFGGFVFHFFMLLWKTILVVDDDGDRGKLEQKPDTEEGRGAMNSKCPTTHLHNLLSNHCSCYMRYTWTKKMGKAEILKTKYNNNDMCPSFSHTAEIHC